MRMRWLGVTIVAAATWGCGGSGSSGAVGPSSVGDSGGGGGGGGAGCTSAPATLVSGLHGPVQLAVDATDVYWTELDGAYAGLYRVPKSGGAPTLVASVRSLQDDGVAWDFALDDRTIYLVDGGVADASPSPGGVQIIDKATGATRFVPALASDCHVPFVIHVAASGGTVYWVQHDAVRHDPACSGVTEARRIVALDPGSDTPRVVVEPAPGGNAMTTDGQHVFWTDATATWRVATTGGTPEMLAKVSGDQLATDGNVLFAYHGTTLWAITAPEQYAPAWGGSQPVEGIAVDDAHVYFGSYVGMRRIGKDGGDAQPLGPGDANTPAVDATHVYYFSDSNLLTACK